MRTLDLPTVNGQSFGIRATDRALQMGNLGDNTYALFVGMSEITSDITIALRHENFVTNVSTRLDSISIQSLLPTSGQIELIFAKAAGSNELLASYVLGADGNRSGWIGQSTPQKSLLIDAGTNKQNVGAVAPIFLAV